MIIEGLKRDIENQILPLDISVHKNKNTHNDTDRDKRNKNDDTYNEELLMKELDSFLQSDLLQDLSISTTSKQPENIMLDTNSMENSANESDNDEFLASYEKKFFGTESHSRSSSETYTHTQEAMLLTGTHTEAHTGPHTVPHTVLHTVPHTDTCAAPHTGAHMEPHIHKQNQEDVTQTRAPVTDDDDLLARIL